MCMNRNLIIKNFLWITLLVLSSCRTHEEIGSLFNKNTEYTNKSLWKEDEEFIKNVKAIYDKNANQEYVQKNFGQIYWDYAMSFKRSNSSFLNIPIVKNGKVVKNLITVLKDNRVYFIFKEDKKINTFFQDIIFSDRERIKPNETASSISSKLLPCRSITIIIGYVEGGSGEGNEIPITRTDWYCPEDEEPLDQSTCLDPSGDCSTTSDSSGGGGGTGYTYDQTKTDPCSDLKTQNANAEYKAKIEELDKTSVLSQKHETGFSEDKNGNFTNLPKSTSTDSSDGLTINITSDTKGYTHTHQNDYEDGTFDSNGNPKIRQPIRMFSPADVNAVMKIASYTTNGDYSEIYGTMISSYGNYTIKFTGSASDIITGFDTPGCRNEYRKFIENEKGTLEAKFLRFISEKMKVDGISLYKIKNNGTIQNKTLNAENKVDSKDCPK